MATALNDPGLTIDPIPFDSYEPDPEDLESADIDRDDVLSILEWIGQP
jgi:hypothetical protein